MIDHVYEKNYDAAKIETLKDASSDEVANWNERKAELLRKDRALDHAADKISLSYKGAVVDNKLDALRKKMIEADHALIIGEYYDKLD